MGFEVEDAAVGLVLTRLKHSSRLSTSAWFSGHVLVLARSSYFFTFEALTLRRWVNQLLHCAIAFTILLRRLPKAARLRAEVLVDR